MLPLERQHSERPLVVQVHPRPHTVLSEGTVARRVPSLVICLPEKDERVEAYEIGVPPGDEGVPKLREHERPVNLVLLRRQPGHGEVRQHPTQQRIGQCLIHALLEHREQFAQPFHPLDLLLAHGVTEGSVVKGVNGGIGAAVDRVPLHVYALYVLDVIGLRDPTDVHLGGVPELYRAVQLLPVLLGFQHLLGQHHRPV